MSSSILNKSLHGIFPVVKPRGITSAKLLDYIKEKLSIDSPSDKINNLKMGHGGTLDNSATGVLVVGIGDGCKQLKFFLKGDKTYFVRGQLGTATDTYNDTGQVTMTKEFDHVTADMIQERLQNFEGRIKQVPPMYSALKRDGKRYSDWAREGKKFEVKPRIVYCRELSLQEFEPPDFAVTVVCGPGFYVRSLIHDLGKAVNSCAHVRQLERTKQGPFHISEALSEHQWNYEHISMSINKWTRKLERYSKSHDKW